MTNGNDPIYPNAGDRYSKGLTKREYFAGLALQGMMSENPSMALNRHVLATHAVLQADALIQALNKEPSNE